MTAKVKLYLINFIVFIIIVFYSGCVKEVFVQNQNLFLISIGFYPTLAFDLRGRAQ